MPSQAMTWRLLRLANTRPSGGLSDMLAKFDPPGSKSKPALIKFRSVGLSSERHLAGVAEAEADAP